MEGICWEIKSFHRNQPNVLSDRLPMPSQQGLGSDDGGDFTKDATAKHLGLGCQASALIVVQTGSFSSELLAEHPVLLPQVIDRVALLLAQPSGDRNQQQSKRAETDRPAIKACRVRCPR